MNKDASDFMTQEYDRISTAYFGLREQMNEMFKAYLTLIGFALTVLAAVVRIGGAETSELSQVPDIVSGVLVAVSLLGLLVAITLVVMRMEMILYARTINGVRRYFAQSEDTTGGMLAEYLILPTTDTKPPFYEGWRATLMQVSLIGLLDGAIAGVGVLNLLSLRWGWAAVLAAGVVLLHVGAYRWLAWRREGNWQARFPKELVPSNV